uniref:Centromere protein J-like n=1 Tax=Phallusia mammillata TaxID=59560 RepID=A0A6F9D9S2_9ASCI|nr:centromere protein J-like [Phallusia mammillata]
MDGAVPSCTEIDTLFDKLEDTKGTSHDDVMKKLQAIRLWQLMQQEELKKQQQSQLALLKGQGEDTKEDLDAMSDYSDNDEQEELEEPSDDDIESVDEVLAFPLDDASCGQLETIAEQPSVVDISDAESADCEKDVANSVISDSEFLSEVDDQEKSDNEDGENKVENEESVKKNRLLVDEEAHEIPKQSDRQLCFDDVPVAGGGNKKTFEQLLADQLKLNNNIDKTAKKNTASTPKRTFLRRGQGIARFKGPPIRAKKKAPEATQASSATQVAPTEASVKPVTNTIHQTERPLSDAIPVQENNEEKKPVTRIRKTARKKEPIKELKLKPVSPKPHVHFQNPISSFPNPGFDYEENLLDDHGEQDINENLDDTLKDENALLQESVWSDVNDSVLSINTTAIGNLGPIDFDKTSNETFEQMEKFCNQRYGSDSPMKKEEKMSQNTQPPQPSKLMQSLFPSLGPKTSNVPKSIAPAKENTAALNPVPTKQDEQPKILKTKLEEMECEIKKFQDETCKLSSVRKQEEEQLRLLKKEFEEFQKQKEDELQRLDDFKKMETKKLKKERKLFEDHITAVKSLPNKKDREYIRELEKNICELQDEFKVKEQRLTAANNRLRTQLDTANKDNELLKERLHAAEEQIEILKKGDEKRRSKKSGAVWKAINNIVDSTTIDENEPTTDICVPETKTPVITNVFPKPVIQKKREPLVDRNDNHLCKNQEDMPTEGRKIERKLQDGSHEISYSNGTKKVVSADGTNTNVQFANGDVKTIGADGSVSYMYKSSGTKHTTHTNGMQVIEFSNKQIERHFPDGSKHISFADGSSKMMKLNGTEETIFPDGTVMVVKPNGHKTIEFSNGQREIHTAEYKRREYPEGTCKTVYSDGRQETMYASGRLRIKDANGVLIVDRMLDKTAGIVET